MTLRRAAGLVAFNLVLFLVLAELVSLIAYAWQTGGFYYTHDEVRSPPSKSESIESHRIHPYFGFTWTPGDELWLHRNNHGFLESHDYPLTVAEDKLVVGIFGGSLASNLAHFETTSGVLQTRLAAHLGRNADQVIVLNFAQAGYKQPQQLLVATYFRALGQRLDLAINVDGFNEIALAGRNAVTGWELSMPSVDHISPLRQIVGFPESPDGVLRMWEARHSWEEFSHYYKRAWSRQGWETHLASGFVFDWLLCKFYLRRYQAAFAVHTAALRSSGNDDSWLLVDPAEQRVAAQDTAALEEAMGPAVELWARASKNFSDAQHAAGSAYLQVVQPNQYFPTERQFGPEETQIAFSDKSTTAEFVKIAYYRLEEALPGLREAGVDVWSATRLFDDVDEPVYRDDCCHLNDLGHRLLAEKIADLAAEALATQTPSAPAHEPD